MPVRLTEKAVAKAVTDSAAGKSYDVTDAGAAGLILRAAPRGAVWIVRFMWDGSFKRLKLGPVAMIDLTAARSIATSARELLATTPDCPNEHWLREQLLRRRIIEAPPLDRPPPPPPKPRTWTFAQARTAFLDEVLRTLREDTWRDRRYMLGIAELKPLDDLAVASISRLQLAGIVGDIHKSGRERHAEHLVEILRPMWAWLGEDGQQLISGVLPGAMKLLKAPKRSRREDDGQGTYVPPPAELGRLCALLQADVVDDTVADAGLLLLVTAQRRRTVVNARLSDFVDEDGSLVWKVPPAHRKTARRLGSTKTHDLPLPALAGDMVRRRIVTAAEEAKKENGRESIWLFPAMRPRRKGDSVSHLHADTLTHLLDALPGIAAAPHDVRRGFTTHGQDVLGLDEDELKIVLDHAEGKGSDDVTEGSYSKARRLKRKASMLEPWAAMLAGEAAKAKLGDLDAIRAEIVEAYRRQKTKNKAKAA